MTATPGVAMGGSGRLERLVALLAQDPNNLPLLSDAAETALSERRPEVAADLLARYAAIEPLPPKECNLAGLAAMQLNRFDEAAGHFSGLVQSGVGGAVVRFNLAWARAMGGETEAALDLIDDEAVRTLPQAARLKLQILHEHGEMGAAAELARAATELHPADPGLMAAASVLAVDLDDFEQAQRCALAAGEHPDALATLGTLALDQGRAADALEKFDAALAMNERSARAWLGRGLVKLAMDRADEAAPDLDRGAELFGTHLGSWIAAGWAHVVNRNVAAGRARFERAMDLDPTFAEAHGSLAVIDILEGAPDSARERAEKALRLDRSSSSGALARMLLAAAAGDEATAQRIFELAVNSPIDERGRTIAEAAAKLGMKIGA
ncbi:MAG: tetratricopeptide repeat protein [Pseudomonadota bacterium]|nr:tetratricopeptide repeat protein [Pseudomonadota bacterium]